MRILLINDHLYSAGGTERYIHVVSRGLALAGHEVAVLYGSGHIQPVGEVRYECVPELLPLPVYDWEQRSRAFAGWVERLRPEVVHFNNFDVAEVIEWFARRLPAVQMVHVQSRYVCPGEGKYYKRQERACSRPFGPYCVIAPYLHGCGTLRPAKIIAHYGVVARWLKASIHLKSLMTASDYMRSELLKAGIPDAKISVNPIGLEGVEEQEASLAPGTQRVVYSGRLYDYKGGDQLIRALAWVATPCVVQFIGDGPERGRLEELARKAPRQHKIEFLNWVDSQTLAKHLRMATVLVLPSRWPEPFGLAGLEAMAYGIPVVAYDVGGIGQWLRPGQNGLMVPPGRVRELGEAIQRALADTGFRAELAAGARLTALEFSMRAHLDRLQKIYAAALASAGAAAAA